VKRAIENRFIAWLFALDLSAPQWRHYFQGVFLVFGGGVFLVGGVIVRSSESAWMSFTGFFCCALGALYFTIGKLVKDAQKTQADQAKRLIEQDERIRALEATVAALTPLRPTP
jgi:hypothetical protein